MQTHPTVFEYGHLCADKQLALLKGYVFIPELDFTYLEQRCLTEDGSDFNQLLQPRFIQGCRLLQVKSYAGVIFVPSGQHIEVLPKTGRKSESLADARKTLLVMLQALGEFRHIELESTRIETLSMPLLEVFIIHFLESVNHVVKRGLRRDYVAVEDNLLVKKGKLNVAKQIKHNLTQQQRFYCEFDEYLNDNPVNRLLKSALIKVRSYCTSHHNHKFSNELLFALDDVPASNNVKHDFNQVQLSRGMAHYRPALAWAKLILGGFSPMSMKGDNDSPTLLFPMEVVFEAYVAQVLHKQLPSHLQLRTQIASRRLAVHVKESSSKELFVLKPDLLIEHNTTPVYVLDTKWKLVDGTDASNKYGLSQADFYQMFAYGHKYLAGEGELFLIYPATDSFSQPIKGYFQLAEKLRLLVVPFVIDTGGKSHLIYDFSTLRTSHSARLNIT